MGSGAHAGQRTFDVEAPAYRTSVLIGALAAAVVFAALWYLWLSRRHARRSETRLREELSGPGASQGTSRHEAASIQPVTRPSGAVLDP